MAENPNVARTRDGYAAFAKGDFAVLTDLFVEDLVWHDSGRNQLSGEYRGRDAVFGFFGKLMEITEGSFCADLRALFADDERGVALVVLTASRGGRSVEIRKRTSSICATERSWNSGMPPPTSTLSTSSPADPGGYDTGRSTSAGLCRAHPLPAHSRAGLLECCALVRSRWQR
jgi:uncharacterized protein